MGQCSVGRLYRSALHQGREFQQPHRALGEARRLRGDAVAVLLEHGAAKVGANSFARTRIVQRRGRNESGPTTPAALRRCEFIRTRR